MSSLRPDEIDDILECIGRAWRLVPEQRFGQLIDNARHSASVDLFTTPDWDLVESIERFARGHTTKG